MMVKHWPQRLLGETHSPERETEAQLPADSVPYNKLLQGLQTANLLFSHGRERGNSGLSSSFIETLIPSWEPQLHDFI